MNVRVTMVDPSKHPKIQPEEVPFICLLASNTYVGSYLRIPSYCSEYYDDGVKVVRIVK